MESVEDGVHSIVIANQAGCIVGDVYVGGVRQGRTGPQTVKVNGPQDFKTDTVFVDVYCQ